MTRYREYRAMGLSRRSALTWLLPIRLRLMWAIALGRPVMYRMTVRGGVMFEAINGAVIAECKFHGAGVGLHASSDVDFKG